MDKITISVHTNTHTPALYQRISKEFDIPLDNLTSAALDWALESIEFMFYVTNQKDLPHS